ncbi:MAG TPA: hypothetical protein VGI51_06690, partial [Steroidobacteraceae bacterium]
SRQKKNLLVFIRPKILRDANATESTSEIQYNDLRQNQKSLNNGHIMLLPHERQPAVQALPPGAGVPAPPPADTNAQGATPNGPPPSTAPPTILPPLDVAPHAEPAPAPSPAPAPAPPP